MSIGLTRGVLIGSIIVLIVIASAFGFIYLQTSSSLAGQNSSISSLTRQLSSDQSQISSLQSQLAHTSTVTSTIILTNTLVSTETSISTVTNTATVTSVSTVVSTPSMVNVTRRIIFFLGNTTLATGIAGATIKIYVNSTVWADTIVTNSQGAATTHSVFTSGQVLTLNITIPVGNCWCSETPRKTVTTSVTVSVPMMEQADAASLKRNFIQVYVS